MRIASIAALSLAVLALLLAGCTPPPAPEPTATVLPVASRTLTRQAPSTPVITPIGTQTPAPKYTATSGPVYPIPGVTPPTPSPEPTVKPEAVDYSACGPNPTRITTKPRYYDGAFTPPIGPDGQALPTGVIEYEHDTGPYAPGKSTVFFAKMCLVDAGTVDTNQNRVTSAFLYYDIYGKSHTIQLEFGGKGPGGMLITTSISR